MLTLCERFPAPDIIQNMLNNVIVKIVTKAKVHTVVVVNFCYHQVHFSTTGGKLNNVQS